MRHIPCPSVFPSALALLTLLYGCKEMSLNEAAADFTSTYGAPSATSASGDDDDDYTPPPEEEERRSLPPAQTDVFVFIANPDRDTVTRVNVRTLDVDTTPVGTRPEIVATTSDYRRAVVFNEGDDSVTVIDALTLEKQTIEVRDNLNQMELSPDGKWAVLWHSAAAVEPDDPDPEGIQSFNEVSFVDVDNGVHYAMAVGFDPRMVRFTPDSLLAVVVSDAYLATIDLTLTPLLPELTELQPGVLSPPQAEEVVLSPDGRYAWVRPFGATELLVVDLANRTVDAVTAGDNPTDLDLSPDGSEAVAVARGSSELYIFDANEPFVLPQIVAMPPDGQYGSLLLSPDGSKGIVYTTAVPSERFGVWDRDTDAIIERSLVKPVDTIDITPTGGSLLVFHTLTDGPNTDPIFAGEPALTLIDLNDFRSNPLLLLEEPSAWATSNTGRLGYFIMEGAPYLAVLDFVTLLPEQYTLSSLPVFLGALPDLDAEDGDEPPAWVSQEHDLGRISFFDPDDHSIETLTGFELNAGIEEEP